MLHTVPKKLPCHTHISVHNRSGNSFACNKLVRLRKAFGEAAQVLQIDTTDSLNILRNVNHLSEEDAFLPY